MCLIALSSFGILMNDLTERPYIQAATRALKSAQAFIDLQLQRNSSLDPGLMCLSFDVRNMGTYGWQELVRTPIIPVCLHSSCRPNSSTPISITRLCSMQFPYCVTGRPGRSLGTSCGLQSQHLLVCNVSTASFQYRL